LIGPGAPAAGRTGILAGLAGASARRPIAALVLAGLPLAGLALGSPRLRLEPRIDLLAPDDPLARAERARQEIFGRDFSLVVALYRPREAGGVLTSSSLAALEDLHGGLAAIPGVSRPASLVNSPALVDVEGAPAGSPIWPGSRPGAAELLLRRLERSPLQRLMFLSLRGSLTPIYLETEEGAAGAEVARRIRSLAAEVASRHPEAGEVLVVGPDVVEGGLAGHVFEDLSRLVPVAVAVMVAGLLLATRSAALVIAAVLHCLALLGAVLGGMSLLGLTLDLVTVLAPVILVPIGVAPLLHIWTRLRSAAAGDGPAVRLDALRLVYARLEGALLGTTATTAIGFLGFLASPVPAVRRFGLALSAGSVAALLLAATLDAAILSLLWRPAAAGRAGRGPAADPAERWLLGMSCSEPALRRRARRALLLCAYLAAAGLVALVQVRIEDTWVGNFDPDSEVARDARRFEEDFLGTNLLAVVVEADARAREARPAALLAACELPASIAQVPGVRGALSIGTLARALEPGGAQPWGPCPAASPEAMSGRLAAWEARGLPLPRRRMLADADLTRFQVLAFVANDRYDRLERTVSEVRRIAEARVGPSGRVVVGGSLAANVRMVRLAVQGQAVSLAVLFVGIAVLAAAYTRSPRSGALLVAPMGLAILATYLLVVLLGVPYGVAVSMFPTLMIGVAVDFAIHLRAGAAAARSLPAERGVAGLAPVVRGIVLNGAIWAAGFGVLAFSRIPPNRHLGVLCSAVLALSTLITLLLIPAVLLDAGRREGTAGS
jgi:predicted RND superfamily exporter protein